MKLENEILDEYKTYLLEDGKSSATIESYMSDIKSFTEYLKNKDSIFKGQIKRFYISSYKEYLLSERYRVSTINKKVNSLHSFNIFLKTSLSSDWREYSEI
jgi:integrase/recombinase XerD